MRLLTAVPLLLLAQAPAPPPAPDVAPAQPAWLPRETANLTVLDKVSARLTPVTVKVGEQARAGPLTIAVRACDVRPPDMAADSAAFLDVTDATPGAPEFHAWIVLSAPGVSAMQHPVYDVRLVACR